MCLSDHRKKPRNLTYEKVYSRALELFEQDSNKTNAWWTAKQDSFGNMAPYEMVKNGKARKLMKIMEKCGV